MQQYSRLAIVESFYRSKILDIEIELVGTLPKKFNYCRAVVLCLLFDSLIILRCIAILH